MANRHFGKAGDVWKHFMLCEVLAALGPTHYAESHAGSGAYDLVHNDERNYGVGHFIEVDPVSADDLRLWGRNLELSRCQVVERDGMTVVAEWLDSCAGSRCVVHIDPFDPFAAQPGGLSAVRLAGQVAESGSVLLGQDLIRTYDGKRLPDGQLGRLRFTRRPQV